LNPYEEF